jgi:hypothetical protein
MPGLTDDVSVEGGLKARNDWSHDSRIEFQAWGKLNQEITRFCGAVSARCPSDGWGKPDQWRYNIQGGS